MATLKITKIEWSQCDSLTGALWGRRLWSLEHVLELAGAASEAIVFGGARPISELMLAPLEHEKANLSTKPGEVGLESSVD